MVMVENDELKNDEQAILLLWHRVNTSLASYYKLIKAFGSPEGALKVSAQAWADLGLHANHVARQQDASDSEDALFLAQIDADVQANNYHLLFVHDDDYPLQLNQLFDPPPVLFYRGNVARLSDPQIAIVGSRKPTEHAQKFTFDMAQYLSDKGFTITSGLAEGVDGHAHLGALAQSPDKAGRTVGVMGTGIDVIYPKRHAHLINRIVNEGGCIITELLPKTPASKHTFPRRNRLVAGLSLGTIVTEATVQSGSLITARLTNEQGKQVFALPSRIDNANAEGCHHLIREGATLIYHPDQVIEDIVHQLPDPNIDTPDVIPATYKAKANPIAPQPTNSNRQSFSHLQAPSTNPKPAVDIPEHLQAIWTHLDFDGQDLDALVDKTGLDTPTLLAQLMELELMGVVEQVGGRYKRV